MSSHNPKTEKLPEQDESIRFPAPSQARNRETAINDFWLTAIMEDRADTALPPVELWEVAGHG